MRKDDIVKFFYKIILNVFLFLLTFIRLGNAGDSKLGILDFPNNVLFFIVQFLEKKEISNFSEVNSILRNRIFKFESFNNVTFLDVSRDFLNSEIQTSKESNQWLPWKWIFVDLEKFEDERDHQSLAELVKQHSYIKLSLSSVVLTHDLLLKFIKKIECLKNVERLTLTNINKNLIEEILMSLKNDDQNCLKVLKLNELYCENLNIKPTQFSLPFGLEVLSLKISQKGLSLNAYVNWVAAIAGCSTLKEFTLDCLHFQHSQIYDFSNPFLKEIARVSAIMSTVPLSFSFSNLKIDYILPNGLDSGSIENFRHILNEAMKGFFFMNRIQGNRLRNHDRNGDFSHRIHVFILKKPENF